MKNLKTSYQKLIITKITYHSYLFKCYNYYVMSMKKILIIILFIISITLLFTLKSINNKNTSLEKEISTKQQLIKDKEKEKIDKTEELNNLKESNKEKEEEYERVKKWNQEIIGYLEQ